MKNEIFFQLCPSKEIVTTACLELHPRLYFTGKVFLLYNLILKQEKKMRNLLSQYWAVK